MLIAAVFIVLVFVTGLVSRRLERTIITVPMLFTGVGILLFFIPAMLPELEAGREIFLTLAEVALVLVLFTDATRISLRDLRGSESLPVRLLGIGMPLTILLGIIITALVLPQLSIWEAGILAAILAPTDAGLGAVVVNSRQVPVRIRQALNVESGLNDGLSVPFLMLFIALAMASTEEAGQVLLGFVVEQVGLGALVGFIIGWLGGRLLSQAKQRDWMAESFQQLGLLSLALLCLVAAEPIGGSPFIAAFVAGLAIQVGFKEACGKIVEFSEAWGELLNFFVFFIFGLLAGPVLGRLGLVLVLYAVLSLTLIRMLPVAISLIGTRLTTASVLFVGWFGPRGLASIVLGLVFLEQETHLPGEPIIRLAVIATVLLSILAHGVTATPGINLYARQLETMKADAPEHQTVAVIPSR